MNGDIKLSAPGGLPGDIWLDTRNPAVSDYTFVGRVVAVDGSPRSGVSVTVFERRSLTIDVRLAATTTDARGMYRVGFSLPGASANWEVFVRAVDPLESESVESALIYDIDPGTHTVDLVLGEGQYQGRSEWDRISAKLEPLLGDTLPKDVPADRLEWLSKRADVFPLHLAMWVQAYRLSFDRDVKAESCYAFLRAGMPADLPGILRAGENAWASALRNAWTRRVIPRPGDGTPNELDAEVATELAAMRELMVEAAMAETTIALNPRSFFDSVGLDSAKQEEFYRMWLAHTGTLAEFWADVETAPNLTAAVADFQYAIQGAAVVGYHPPTLAALRAAGVATITDTAAWDYSAWDSFLVDQNVTPPDGTPGANGTERRQNYARTLERASEDAYPTRSLRHRIDADEGLSSAPPHSEHLVGFFDDNLEFDLLETNIDRWVADNPTAFAGASDPAEARANLEIVQRVYRLAPRLGRYETTKVLLEQGIRSAGDVAALTRDEFVDEFTQHFTDNHHEPEALAERVWDRAVKIAHSAEAMVSYLGLATGVEFQPMVGMGDWGFESDTDGLPSLADILGSLDYCACEHCRSVFSPAAYLADLLHFLSKRPAASGNALSVLGARRPDIEHILLNCANTNTVLPYIDLVNELLERYFAETLDGSSYQTTWSDEDLRLRPEHQDPAVYEGTVPDIDAQITELVHPWVLPFHLPELEARQLLEHLGEPRHKLMELLVDDDGDPVTPSADAIVAEALGMSSVEHSIVAGTFDGNASEDDREFWGFEVGDTSDWHHILNGFAGDVREILRRGDYSLEQLQELLTFTYIDPDHYVGTGIKFNWSETCDLGQATISSLDKDPLDRLHRFTRLQRRTGIPGRMLNVLLEDVGGSTLDAAFLAKLVAIRDIQRRTGLAWDELATWWAVRIDARVYESGKPSLYHRRFLTAQDATPAGFQPESSRGDTLTGEQDPPQEISADELPTVLAAASLSESDYKRLIATFADDVFTFANLTAIFRAASLARAAKLSIEDLVQLRSLTGIDPFDSPAATLAFFAALDGIRASGFSIAELNWLLRNVGTAMIDQTTIARALGTLSRGLATIETEIAQLVDPDGSAVSNNLADVVSDVTWAMKIINKESGEGEIADGAFIDIELASFVDPAIAKEKLVTSGGTIVDVVERRNWVLRTFVEHRRKRALLIDTAAAAFQIEASVAERLLYEIDNVTLLHQPDTGEALATSFTDSFATDAQIAAGLVADDHPTQFAGWLRLGKAALLARTHRITARQLTWYSGHLTGDWLDLDALPLDGDDSDASFTAWDRLRKALDLRELFADVELGHYTLADAGTAHAALDLLAEYNGWDAAELKFVADEIGWATVAAFNDEIALTRLRAIVAAGQRLGVGLDVLWTWVHGPMTLAKAANIEAVIRAKYGVERWSDIAKPHRDRLRELQRDALVAAILATSEALSTREEIFAHLLIDVEMSPCMLTTRIVQANASVQMFVQRVLLQLEAPAVTFQAGAASAWSWMKNYRVWEANRKVFLYPENWLEPELRRDKTPEFQQLESVLLQDTLDDSKVEHAVAGYLAGLDRVANLEIVAVYAKNQFATVWLVGRTQSAPRTWFLRKRELGDLWSPWEDLPLQIDSDNIVLFERKGRLLLFWLTAVDTTISIKGQEFNDPENHRAVELGISWAELDERGWSQTVISQRTQPLLTLSDEPDSHLLRGWILSDQINLIVYRAVGPGKIEPRAEFHYDVISRHVALAGTDFDHEAYPGYIATDGHLVNDSWVGLQDDYRVEGQRFAKTRLNDGFNGFDLAPIAAISPLDPAPDSTTLFVQGTYAALVFHRGPASGYRTLLHQGDLWTLDEDKRFSPVVYDDRQRKYLLEPRDAYVDASSEGDDISPGLLGTLNTRQYQGCLPSPDRQPLNPTVRTNDAQRLRDGVTSREAWPNGIPGVNMSGGGYNVGNAKQLYYQSEHTMEANTDTTQDVAPKFEFVPGDVRLRMTTLYHPFARKMVEEVALHGIDALYRPAEESPLFRQADSGDPMSESVLHLDKELLLIGKPPGESYEFGHESAYGLYNWEVFFHIPMLIADKLGADQRWAEAQRWYHTMFDPIETVNLEGETAATKFWRIKPFVEQAQNLAKNQFKAMLGIGVTPAEQETEIARFASEVNNWLNNPFDPHAIARIRPGVYQRTLLRHYFDNLIEWADHLFRQDTLESINEATILYVLVSQLLGPRPEEVPGPEGDAKSYHELVEDGLDAFSNAAQKLENCIIVPTEPAEHLGCGGTEPLPPWVCHKVTVRFWYFCYPPNPELLKYWDIIADRLWKIRHCQNIEGIERSLAIFQPPIDPGLLVRAAAAGVDLASVLAELDSGLPPYRFRSVIARANTFCAELRSLGSALLQAIEKRDAEALSRMRAEHELAMLAVVRDVRVRQLDEARGAVASLELAKTAIEGRLGYYEGLLEGGINDQEATAMTLSVQSGNARMASQAMMALGGALQMIPDFTISVGTDTSAKTTIGGVAIGGAIKSAGEALGIIPMMLDTAAGWITTKAQYDRRSEEWQFQIDQAKAEVVRVERDIAVAEIRVAIAERELANHDLQVEQSKATDHFMRDKFSNSELYDWMVGQLSTLYFQTYQLAFDLAKRAERAYRHELAIDSGASIIKYGYWDSLRKGLLAGEKLGHDLLRLELAYMDRDVREFELRKSVSLAQVAPQALRDLQEKGECTFELPEVLFDIDHPGHYLRRIRGVRLTIPAVVGPYTTLGARLQLDKHKTRVVNANLTLDPNNYPENPVDSDTDRFRYGYGRGEAIATSTASADGGVFNLDFGDERYLPFEYAGAISSWTLTLPNEVRQFDYRTISDVIVHLDYTARDGGADMRTAAEAAVAEQLNAALEGQQLMQLIVVPDAFPNEWEQFLSPASEATTQTLTLPLTSAHFPYFAQRRGFEITQVDFVLLLNESVTAPEEDSLTLTLTDSAPTIVLAKVADVAYMYGHSGTLENPEQPATWTLSRAKGATPGAGDIDHPDGWFNRTKVRGLLMLARYSLT